MAPRSSARPVAASFDPFGGAPRLHGARRVGVRPGTELIHPLAVTGARPLTWQVDGLPAGVSVDADGILRGQAPAAAGTVPLRVRVSNAQGAIDETVELCVGDLLALTPPMGWNSWNLYGTTVTAEVVVRVAEAMVATGMRDLGYQFVNIDDHWHAGARGKGGVPVANPKTFPDGIAPVAARVHELGLKLGIYSDAAELTCGGCFGGLGFEEVDAQAYASWGVDLLKYDYCHAPRHRADAIERYGKMSRALAATDRSIVFSVCEWGLRKPWLWAPKLGAAYWRTTPDIFDSYNWGVTGVRGIAWRNERLHLHARPGHWNDPDMLLVGNRGQGDSTGYLRLPNSKRKVWRFRGISDAQVHSHVTLWAMMAAPLLASHDLAASTELDLALLLNPEILAIDQDPLGVQGHRISSPPGTWTMVKPLVDGAVAVSLTNMTRAPRSLTVPLTVVGLPGSAQVTDAWALQDVGERTSLSARLGPYESVAYICRPTQFGGLVRFGGGLDQ